LKLFYIRILLPSDKMNGDESQTSRKVVDFVALAVIPQQFSSVLRMLVRNG
jgi:hypothetical protein